MKIAALIARLLLGVCFFVFGLNGFLMFIPMGPLPPGNAGLFATVLTQSHYFLFVSAFQLIGGTLLLINRYVPFALTILAPVIVNILLYHILLFHNGLPMAFVVAILWCVVAYRQREHFKGLFVQRTS